MGFLPGVKDNVGDTSRKSLEELLSKEFDGKIYTSTQYRISGVGSREDANKIASELLGNAMIQHWSVFDKTEEVEMPLPEVHLQTMGKVDTISLDLDDEGLIKLSKDKSLALSLADMKTVRDYYSKDEVKKARVDVGLPEQPTDIELEMVAQTQSEHCKHRIFNGRN